MRNFAKKLTIAFVLALALIAVFGLAVNAAEVTHSGDIGAFTYQVTDDGVLTISGNGSILGRWYDGGWTGHTDQTVNQLPWYVHGLRDSITEVVLDTPNLVEIKPWMLAGLNTATKMTIPATLEKIGSEAFARSNALATIRVAGNEYEDGVIDFTNIKSIGHKLFFNWGLNLTTEIHLGLDTSFVPSVVDFATMKVHFVVYEGADTIA